MGTYYRTQDFLVHSSQSQFVHPMEVGDTIYMVFQHTNEIVCIWIITESSTFQVSEYTKLEGLQVSLMFL